MNGQLTLLNELETIGDDTLVAPEEEATIMEGSPRLALKTRYFGSEWNTTADDTTGLSIVLKIVTRVRFTDVSCEGASVLCVKVARE